MRELHLTTDNLRQIARGLDSTPAKIGMQYKINDGAVILECTTNGWIFVQPLDAHLVIHAEDEN